MTKDIHIWFRETESLHPGEVRAAEATLSGEEQAHASRFHFPNDRRDYIVAHDLLRRSLSKFSPLAPTDWQFEIGEFGKPLIASWGMASSESAPGLSEGRAPSFSLTHTRGLVACAIAFDLRVGVDVERLDRDIEATAIATRFFSPQEAAALQRCDAATRTLRFLELWTLKEAYLKAVGLGLTQPLADLSFDLEERDTIAFRAPPGTERPPWFFAVFAPSRQTRMAVAACGGESDQPRFVARADRDAAAADGDMMMVPLRATAW